MARTTMAKSSGRTFHLLVVLSLAAAANAQSPSPSATLFPSANTENTASLFPSTTTLSTSSPTSPQGTDCSSICPQGMPDPSLNDKVLFVQDGVNITCGVYQDFAERGVFSDLECLSAHYVGLNACGCSSVGDVCQLCADGSLPPDLALESSPPFRCIDLAGFALEADPGTRACAAAQMVDGFYCGCPNVTTEGVCRLCNATLPEPEREVDFGGNSVACSFIEFSANVNPVEQCAGFQELSSACCEGLVPPTPSPTPLSDGNPVCHVCGEEGVNAAFPHVVLNLPGLGSYNCSSLLSFGAGGFLRSSNCRTIQLMAKNPCGCGVETQSPSVTSSPSTAPSVSSASPAFTLSVNPAAGDPTQAPVSETSEPTPSEAQVVTAPPSSLATSNASHLAYMMGLAAVLATGCFIAG